MKKSDIKNLIRTATESKTLCRVSLKYAFNNHFYFPLLTSDKFFLSAIEDDFILDGFSIRRFCDVTFADTITNKYSEILKAEGITNNLVVPKIDLTDWQSIFVSLFQLNKNIIIEKESLNEEDCQFVIGKIIKANKNKVIFKNFNADGLWEDELYEIPYSQITSISFSTRYVNTFSKYLR